MKQSEVRWKIRSKTESIIRRKREGVEEAGRKFSSPERSVITKTYTCSKTCVGGTFEETQNTAGLPGAGQGGFRQTTDPAHRLFQVPGGNSMPTDKLFRSQMENVLAKAKITEMFST